MNKEFKTREKKKHIVEALKRRLERDVYSNITIQDVADEAQFSKGGILYYFPSKEDLYLELMRELFSEIEEDQRAVLRGNLDSGEKASISALFGIEKFVLDKKTIRIFINLIMYGFEDEKIMVHIREFVRKNLAFYVSLIEDSRAKMPYRRKTDFDSKFIGRIAQTTVLSAGLLESIDPVEMDTMKLVGYVVALFKG